MGFCKNGSGFDAPIRAAGGLPKTSDQQYVVHKGETPENFQIVVFAYSAGVFCKRNQHDLFAFPIKPFCSFDCFEFVIKRFKPF